MQMALLITVSVGLVEGVMESSVPKGARSCSVRPSSPLKATVSRISSPGVFSMAFLFLTILSAARPRPVSSAERRAISSTRSRQALRTAAMHFARTSILVSFQISKARLAAATA